MMPFPACASNQKNRTFGPKNGDRSADRAHFQQLDDLRPLPFEQLQREFSKASPIELDF